jgi:5'(3')-deoxyribonucleotidase
MSEARRIAVDIDEVLASFTPALANYYNEVHNQGPDITIDSFVSYDFDVVWKCTKEDCQKIMENFFKSDHFKKGIKPIEGALDGLILLSSRYELHVVTARQNHLADLTLQWLESHYPNTFADVHFANHYSSDGSPSRKKSEICLEIGAQLLIDDSLRYAEDCASKGIPTILFGNYPWATGEIAHEKKDLIKRVNCWADVAPAVDLLVPLN